jgi:hypothetical protein
MDIENVDAPPTWQFQIGPQVEGFLEGMVNAGAATFYVSPSQTTTLTIAEVSTTSGSSWIPLPNSQWVRCIGGASGLQYRINVPRGWQLKFVVGL